MSSKSSSNARKTYEDSWGDAKKYGDQVLEVLQMARVSSQENPQLFREKARRALFAYEECRESLTKIMQEIAP